MSLFFSAESEGVPGESPSRELILCTAHAGAEAGSGRACHPEESARAASGERVSSPGTDPAPVLELLYFSISIVIPFG